MLRPDTSLGSKFRLFTALVVMLMAWLGLFGSSVARAHPFAASHFDARTDTDAVNFAFRVDAQALMELFDAHAPEQKPAGPEGLGAAQDYILAYFDENFGLANNDQPCPRSAPTRFEYAPKIDKLVVDLRYECGAPLEVLSLRSALFVDEETPHQLIGSFRHIRALERYFFTGGERQATITLANLRQSGPLPSDGPEGSVRIAAPPPGAFSGPGRKAEAPRRTEGLAPRAGTEEPDSATAAVSEASAAESSEPIQAATSAGFGAFLVQGLIHIFGGIDHILFVLTLVLIVRDWKELGWIITSFTLAHSLTLAAVALELIIVSPRLVEPAIAATIIFVALENVFRKEPEARAGLTFGFGLIHGLGFGGALAELGLGGADLVAPLLGFNVGVELGQLAIVLPLFPLVLWARKREQLFRRVRIGAGVFVALLATWWFIERVMG